MLVRFSEKLNERGLVILNRTLIAVYVLYIIIIRLPGTLIIKLPGMDTLIIEPIVTGNRGRFLDVSTYLGTRFVLVFLPLYYPGRQRHKK